MSIMEEFKDRCKGFEVMCEEIAADLRELPTDYKIAERYSEIDQEIYEMLEWYERVKKEKKLMEDRMKRIDSEIRSLNNIVQNFKLREFSRDQLQDRYLP
jgi:DNA-binding transcriptional regulator GbsR (MarR family)